MVSKVVMIAYLLIILTKENDMGDPLVDEEIKLSR